MAATEGTDPTGMRLDAAALKVLAHPLRSRLLGALRRGGPATATELARALGTNTGATSYHLRRLEAVALVADTGDGEGKRRLWRAATESHQWTVSEFAGDDDSDNDGIIDMVDDFIGGHFYAAPKAILARLNKASDPPPIPTKVRIPWSSRRLPSSWT